MGTPNVVFMIGYAPNDETLKRLRVVKAKYVTQRQFYSCRKTNDILKYINQGIAEGDFLGYAGNLEKSSGLFGEGGLLTKEQIKNLRMALRTTDSNIWHGVISFEEEFGEKYMTSYKDAMELLKAELPKFFKDIGIAEDNVVWYAGLHESTDNQHIHLGFFEKEPRIIRRDKERHYRFGTIGQEEMERFRIRVEEYLTDASVDIKRSRRNLTATATETLFHLVGLNVEERQLKRRLLSLYRALPTEGRISYNSKNMEFLRKEIDALVTYIITSNLGLKRDYAEFCSELARFDMNRRRICEEQQVKDVEKYLVSEKYTKDLYRRLGDKVIKAAVAIKRKGETEVKACRTANLKKQAEKKSRAYLLERAVKISADVDDEAIRCFEEYRRRLAIAEYKRLVEEGEIEAE